MARKKLKAEDAVTLTTEIAAPRVGSLRSPMSGYQADGLTPVRLGAILREADAGHPIRMLELFETVEERDAHYIGVLGTRRRSVSQIPISVEAASEDPQDEARAQMVRDWLRRDELTDEVFNILDCIGKGYSFTEILWDTSEGQWMPAQLIRRDPRWFRFDRITLERPMLITGGLQEEPLPFAKFIYASIPAKSGLTLRSGLTRVAAWGWMFKAFTQRDWALFAQSYGQPVRIGKYEPHALEADKEVLWRAVAGIAGDCAAIIPSSMQIEFVEAGNIGAAHTLYKERCDWIDQQISKAVLGQTSTTDALVGGLGSGKEHRAVQKDIETADARSLAAILNRDLIRPWMQLNFGPLPRYPRLKIEQPEAEDLKAMTESLSPLIDRGLPVETAVMLSRFRLPEPRPGAKLLSPQGAAAGPALPQEANSIFKRQPAVFKGVGAVSGTETALHAQTGSGGDFSGGAAADPVTALADRLGSAAGPVMEAMLRQIEAMIEAASSLEEFRSMLDAAFPKIDTGPLATVLEQAMTVAAATGRADVIADA